MCHKRKKNHKRDKNHNKGKNDIVSPTNSFYSQEKKISTRGADLYGLPLFYLSLGFANSNRSICPRRFLLW